MLEKHGGNLGDGEHRRLDVQQEGLHRRREGEGRRGEADGAPCSTPAPTTCRTTATTGKWCRAPTSIPAVRRRREGARHRAASAEVSMIPQNYVKLEGKAGAADAEADGSARRSRRRAARLVELRHRGEGDRGLARVRIFGIDPGSERTGYGCVETDGARHRLVACGAIARAGRLAFPGPAATSSTPGSAGCSPSAAPDCVAIENLFYATNARSALEARSRARRRRCWRPSRRACRSSSTRRPRSSAPSSATAAPRSTQVQQMVKLLLGLGGGAVAARRRRRAGGRDLPRAFAGRRRWRGARPRGCRAHADELARDRPAAAPGAAAPPHARRDRAPARHAPREAAQPHRRRRQRRRLRRAACRSRRSTASASRAARSRCASTRTCARTRSCSSGSRRRSSRSCSSG